MVLSGRYPSPLHVRRWGDGRPVVFLHGLGASSRYWNRIAGTAERYSGIAPDLLGFGRSPKPRTAAYDVAVHVESLLPVVPDGSVVVGHSTGAVLAAALAACFPEKVDGLLLLGLPAYPDEATARFEIAQLGTLASLTVDARLVARVACELMCAFRPLAMLATRLLARNVPADVAVDGVRHTWPSYSRTLDRVTVGHRAADDLLEVCCPVVLMHGRDDPVAPPSLTRALASALVSAGRQVTYREVDGDHHLALRRVDVVAAAVTGLVLRHDAP
ncbi:MAG: alpha/beta fold hydrolase [Jiangellaceae bacterium]